MSEHPIPSEKPKPVAAGLDLEADTSFEAPATTSPEHKQSSKSERAPASLSPNTASAGTFHTDPERLLTFGEGCAFVRLSRRKLWELVQRNEVPHLRVGRLIRFRRAALIAWSTRLEEVARG